MAKKLNQEELRQQSAAEAVSKTEEFFNKHKKLIYGCFIAILAIAAIIMCYSRFYLQPKRVEAAAQSVQAVNAFMDGNYELALNGDDNNLGLADLVSKYGDKGGAAIRFYAGVAELRLGNNEEAIKYLKKYNGKDPIMAARCQNCIGDAYVNLEDYETALGWYLKAAKTSDNMYSAGYLLNAGAVAEKLGKTDKALEIYKELKDKYPTSPEGMDIDKYITRIEFSK